MIKKYKKGKVKYKITSTTVALPNEENFLKPRKKRGNPALYALPSIFFTLGILIIFSQIAPTLKFTIEKTFSPKYAEILSPIPGNLSYETNENKNTGSTFEAQYFAELLSKIEKSDENVAGAVLPYKYDWEGTFTVSIPALAIKDMPVTANVNSYNENVYSEVLKKSLAHFQGTDLPAPSEYPYDTNTFIYGHSAPSDWAIFHKTSFESALNPLFDINVGDKIIINIEEEILTYSVARIKVTKPDDMSSLHGIEGEKTITLMTCAPPGSTTNRLNVISTLD